MEIREENKRYLDKIQYLETQISQRIKGRLPVAIKNDTEERVSKNYISLFFFVLYYLKIKKIIISVTTLLWKILALR